MKGNKVNEWNVPQNFLRHVNGAMQKGSSNKILRL